MLFLLPVLSLVSPALLFDIPRDTPPPTVFIAPVPLPDPALPDAEYRTALIGLLNNAARRPGVYVSLAELISRDAPPPHAASIVAALTPYLSSTNALETVIPLKVLGRCGKAARPTMSRVLSLVGSPLGQVRLAVAEALGGMFYAPRTIKPSCPPAVTVILTHLLEYDTDRGTKRAAAVALGRCRVANPDVVKTLAAIVGASDTPVALGALAGLEALGANARLALPAIKNRLADKESCANAVPALIAVATPQDAADTLAQSLAALPATSAFYADPTNSDHVQTLLFHARSLPVAKIKPATLAASVAARMDGATTSANDASLAPETLVAAHNADLSVRLCAAKTYLALTGDPSGTATALAGVAGDTTGDPTLRATATTTLGKLGDSVLTVPAVLPAVRSLLATRDDSLQCAAITLLNQCASPTEKAVAPRLSQLLYTAWKAKQNGRVFSLMNVLFRIGSTAKPVAAPVLRKILATEPQGSANADLARTVLDSMNEPPEVSATQ